VARLWENFTVGTSIVGFAAAISGCTSFGQDSSEVLIRDPQKGRYENPTEASVSARTQWQYAAMADYAYEAARRKANAPDKADAANPSPCGSSVPPRVPDEWKMWDGFPSAQLVAQMKPSGLFLLVLERESQPREIAVIFEGTDFAEMPDWEANARWFLRFVPGYEDQYTLTARLVAEEFHQRLASAPNRYTVSPNDEVLRHSSGDPIRIVSVGHSLGGGLAQHFAYTFKQMPATAKGPRV